MKTQPGDRSHLQAFLDTLIPGGTQWPSASEALGENVDRISTREDQAWIQQQSLVIAKLPIDNRISAMQQLEEAEPERFQRILYSLYEAYYGSSKASVAIRHLAHSSPREPSPAFDQSLLHQVIATKAGPRRPSHE